MSTSNLRNYQLQLANQIIHAWDSGVKNVMVQLATGAGKTVVVSHVLKQTGLPFIAVAHRGELVSQLSLTLARYDIYHDVLAPQSLIRDIVRIHHTELGYTRYRHNSPNMVASVDTLVRRGDPRFKNTQILVQDEAHHVLQKNKWGRVAAMFPQARGLYPTATPIRTDGFGLGEHADGVINTLICGPSMRELITAGFLTDYRLVASPSDIDLVNVPILANGDFSAPKLRIAAHKSHITGDIVTNYLKFAAGKQGLTFVTDLQTAAETALSFKKAGINAEVISSKTPDLLRHALIRKFRNKEITQLVNVDLLGEGVDIPGIEVVNLARPTASLVVNQQQIGRALRPHSGKAEAVIIDHVSNWTRHGPPDKIHCWSLDRRDKRKKIQSEEISLRTCLNPECLAVYERIRKNCPYCGTLFIPAQRQAPEHVDGDLLEIDQEFLKSLRNEITRIDSLPQVPRHLDLIAQHAVVNRHCERQEAQRKLRHLISLYAGFLRQCDQDNSQIYRQFFADFKIDILTAQTLNVKNADILAEKIKQVLTTNNVVSIVGEEEKTDG